MTYCEVCHWWYGIRKCRKCGSWLCWFCWLKGNGACPEPCERVTLSPKEPFQREVEK